MKGISCLVKNIVQNLPQRVLPTWHASYNRVDQHIRTALLDVLELSSLIVKMIHMLIVLFSDTRQSLLNLRDIRAWWVVLLESSQSITQILSSHVLIFSRNLMMHVSFKPLRSNSIHLSTIIDVSDSLSCQRTALHHVFSNILSIFSYVWFQQANIRFDSFLVSAWSSL